LYNRKHAGLILKIYISKLYIKLQKQTFNILQTINYTPRCPF